MPPVVRNLLLINVAVFALDMVMGFAGINLQQFFGLFYVMSPFFYPWQLVTYMFMHAGFSHIFFNMFALWIFGRLLEQVWGGKRFLIYYLLCGIGAGITQEVCQAIGVMSPLNMTIGASGAVFGVLLAFGMTFPNEKLFIIPIPFPIKAKYFVIGYAAIELFVGTSSSISDNVAHFAHLGGMLFGLILILAWKNGIGTQRFNKRSSGWSVNSDNYDKNAGSYDKGGFFSKMKERMSASTGETSSSSYGGKHEADYQYNARKKREEEEIDIILDKIRKNGYSALSEEEKRKLFDASRK